jgi:hypothetical protein
MKTYTIAIYRDLLLGTAPDGSDMESIISNAESHLDITIDRAQVIIECGLVLANKCGDDEDFRWVHRADAFSLLQDESGRVFQYAVRRG